MIQQIQAYKISDGRLIMDRNEAATEEAKLALAALLKSEIGDSPSVVQVLVDNASKVRELLADISVSETEKVV